MAKKIYEFITTKQTMNRVREPKMPFDWSINPYRGCAHGCSFCYARVTHSFLGLQADDSFQHHLFIKQNAAEALEAQLARLRKKHNGDLHKVAQQVGLVAIGTATDPYQPMEGKNGITRECLKVLARYHIPTTITTRSPLILRDLDLLQEIHITSINISVNTVNESLCRKMEPATPPPLKRLETVETLVEHGIHAGIFAAPLLPYLTDSYEDLDKLFSTAKQHAAQFISSSVLRLVPEVKTWFFHILEQHYPHLLPVYRQLYRTAYPTARYAEELKKKLAQFYTKFEIPDDIPSAGELRDELQKADSLAELTSQGASNGIGEQLSFLF